MLDGLLVGSQEPRLSWVPEYKSSAGAEAVELAELAGLYLDPWQQLVLRHALGERDDGKWASFEVGVTVARQNGKGGILEARELAGLFLLGEPLIIHSAHQFDTSLEAFGRLLGLIEETPELAARVKRVSRAHGEEGIELKGRQRIRFRTRTKGGGRGFSCDCLVLDEAMVLPSAMHGALLPTLSAREKKTVSGPQVWYTGSAVDEDVHEHGVVFAKIRERGLAGGDPRLAYFEWSADPEMFPDPSDVGGWAQANPGLGIRIGVEYVADVRGGAPVDRALAADGRCRRAGDPKGGVVGDGGDGVGGGRDAGVLGGCDPGPGYGVDRGRRAAAGRSVACGGRLERSWDGVAGRPVPGVETAGTGSPVPDRFGVAGGGVDPGVTERPGAGERDRLAGVCAGLPVVL